MLRSFFALALAGAAVSLPAQNVKATAARAVSAPVTDITYRVTFDRALAARRLVHVEMNFRTAGKDPVFLALPVWTPGAYEVSYFARWIQTFNVTGDGRPLEWEKTDYDSWRIAPAGATQITVSFDYRADTLDNAMAWSRPDFLLFNGPNLFLYPEGRGFDFPALVRIITDSTWRVVTSMTPSGGPNTFSAANYHDLVDMPFFVGRVGLDSTRVGDGWARLAWYPVASVPPDQRASELSQFAKLIPVEAAVFGETPWKSYTVMQIVDSSYPGLAGLEHQSSHVDVITPLALGDPILESIYAHEIFHAWNVKRLRPVDLWPYAYDDEQPTTWLWMSEGVTDYYADVASVRSKLIDSTGFFELTAGKIAHVLNTRPVALGDASLDTWIHPTDGTADIYYDKGSLAGLMLDIMIRDASENKRSLDDVMRQLYREAYKKGTGFTPAQWWGAVSAAAGGKSFTEFNARYIEGREPYPWAATLALAGMSFDTTSVARFGVQSDNQSNVVAYVDPQSSAQEAGLRVGDVIVAVGDRPTPDLAAIRAALANYHTAGAAVPVHVMRGAARITLTAYTRLQIIATVKADPNASPKAAAIRAGIMHP
jgi:predicted metalloprotease with PDZ domain